MELYIDKEKIEKNKHNIAKITFIISIMLIILSKLIFDNIWISLIAFICYDTLLYYVDCKLIKKAIEHIEDKDKLDRIVDLEIELFVKGRNSIFKERNQINAFVDIAKKYRETLESKSTQNNNTTDEIVEMIEGKLKEDVDSLSCLNNSFINILKNEQIIDTGLISNKDNDRITSLIEEIEKIVIDDNYKINVFYSKYKNFIEELMRLLKAYEKSNEPEKYKTEMKNIVDNFIEYLLNLKERIQMNEEMQINTSMKVLLEELKRENKNV